MAVISKSRILGKTVCHFAVKGVDPTIAYLGPTIKKLAALGLNSSRLEGVFRDYTLWLDNCGIYHAVSYKGTPINTFTVVSEGEETPIDVFVDLQRAIECAQDENKETSFVSRVYNADQEEVKRFPAN